jgi:hypothetical protein
MLSLFSVIKLILRIDNKLSILVELASQIEKNQKASTVPDRSAIWLDNQDIMQKLHISPRTLRRRRLDGSIQSTRIKGKFYYRLPDFFDTP